MSRQVTPVYKNHVSAENALDQLVREAGVSLEDVSVLMSEEIRGRKFVMRAASKAPEGAKTGAATG